jgi:hypothetical protein
MAVDFAKSEGYELQPKKSVVIDIIERERERKKKEDQYCRRNSPDNGGHTEAKR